MKLFLCGGGAGDQTIEARKRLNEVIDHSKPCLYIPLAMEQEMYDSCFEWINGELKDVNITNIEMIRSADELVEENLFKYSMLFIGGGNTFKLLNDLKTSGAVKKINKYLRNGGVVFGGSAGAIIFGEDIEVCQIDDINKVDLKDTRGFDLLNGISISCHYKNRTVEKDEQSRQYLLDVSKRRKIIALPEDVTVFINEHNIEIIGNSPYYCFEKGSITMRK